MEMIAHHRIIADLDGKKPGQLTKPVENPPFAEGRHRATRIGDLPCPAVK
jgi:hypothetical protein